MQKVKVKLVNKQKEAYWEINSDGYYPYCSACYEEPSGREMTRYCPNCGAKMLPNIHWKGN